MFQSQFVHRWQDYTKYKHEDASEFFLKLLDWVDADFEVSLHAAAICHVK